MKRKSTSRRVAKAPRKFRVSRRRTFAYTLGAPLKSLAKTQAALFGVVFISTILLSSLLTFAQTNDSINETIDQLVQTLTGDSNSSDNSSEANTTDATADIILPPDNSTNETQNTTALQNLTNFTNLTGNETLNTTNATLTNLTNKTIGDKNIMKKTKKLITKFNNKLKIRGKGKPAQIGSKNIINAEIAVFGDDNDTTYEVHVNLADTKRVKRIKINDANIDDNTQDLFEISDDDATGIVAVNPLINYSTAQVTLDLKGDVSKCAKWDFATSTCNGDWVVVKKYSGGQFETTITPTDPAWINSTSTINVTSPNQEPNNFSSVAADINDSSIFYFHPFDNASTTNVSLFIPFDDRDNNNASDLTGNGNNGVIENGGTLVRNATFGNAMALDGTNDHINVTDSSTLDLTTNMTLEAWIYWGGANNRPNFLCKGTSG